MGRLKTRWFNQIVEDIQDRQTDNTGGTKSNCMKPASTRQFLSIEPYKAETIREKEDENEEEDEDKEELDEHRRTNCYPETVEQ